MLSVSFFSPVLLFFLFLLYHIFCFSGTFNQRFLNHGGGSGGSGTSEHVDISGYLDTLPEQSQTLTDYLKIFFDFLPPQLLAVLLGGIGAAVLCRVLGR